MYTLVLALHSWIRWAAIALGLLATLAAFTNRADRWGLILMIVVDIQMLLGLLLYLALSPFTAAAMAGFRAALHNPQLRFWAVEHPASMIVATALVHVGRAATRSAKTPAAPRTRQIFCFGLATVLMVIATPWPGLANGRPLLRPLLRSAGL